MVLEGVLYNAITAENLDIQDKCFKLQRMRGGSIDRGKRIAAHVQQFDSTESASEPTTGQHTLTSAQYEQLMSLLSKHNMAVTPNTEEQHSAYLAGKSLCLFTAKPEVN